MGDLKTVKAFAESFAQVFGSRFSVLNVALVSLCAGLQPHRRAHQQRWHHGPMLLHYSSVFSARHCFLLTPPQSVPTFVATPDGFESQFAVSALDSRPRKFPSLTQLRSITSATSTSRSCCCRCCNHPRPLASSTSAAPQPGAPQCLCRRSFHQ